MAAKNGAIKSTLARSADGFNSATTAGRRKPEPPLNPTASSVRIRFVYRILLPRFKWPDSHFELLPDSVPGTYSAIPAEHFSSFHL